MLRMSTFLLCMSLAILPSALGQEHWPRFRGQDAKGTAQNQNLPETWSAETGEGIAWKLPIPGLSHASPIVRNDTVFVVKAESVEASSSADQGTPAKSSPEDRWEVWAIHLETGRVLWKRVAFSRPQPKDKGMFSITAHATPATDGKVLVAMFGSQGLHAFDLSGKKLWSQSFGPIGLGDFEGDHAGWEHASSPIIHQGLVFLQCDTPGDDFLVAMESTTGKIAWKTKRDEIRSYGTPTWVPGSPNEIVTNGANFIRGYHATTGQELWRLAGSGQEDTAPLPIFNNDRIIVTSGKRQVKPIFAIKRGARGDITLTAGNKSNKDIFWSSKGIGPYLPTPIILDDFLYSVNDKGILTCLAISTGEQIYRERTTRGGGVVTASLVAADDQIYITKMEGDILVVPAGPQFKLTAINSMGEELVATPAIAKKTMLVRGKHHLFAIRNP